MDDMHIVLRQKEPKHVRQCARKSKALNENGTLLRCLVSLLENVLVWQLSALLGNSFETGAIGGGGVDMEGRVAGSSDYRRRRTKTPVFVRCVLVDIFLVWVYMGASLTIRNGNTALSRWTTRHIMCGNGGVAVAVWIVKHLSGRRRRIWAMVR